ncbi:MAG TPA: hypothetical protein DCM05_04065 [Elusimicrobia bacterium]|nr:hypothetical protein [Elusimicrobiota bacterium]
MPEPLLLALGGLFRKRRILRADKGGWELPIEFHGDSDGIAGSGVADEYYAARDESALIDLSRWELLSLPRARAGLLDRLLTQGARGLRPGQSRRSAWLDDEGRVRALLHLLAAEEDILIECSREAAAGLCGQLGLDRGAPSREPGSMVAFGLLGPKFRGMFETAAPLKEGEHRDARLPGMSVPVRALKTQDLPSGFLLYAALAQAEDLWNGLQSAGVGPLGYSAFDSHRLVEGLPWYGFDVDERCTLEEAGLQEACGGAAGPKPSARLCRLMLDAVAMPGDKVLSEGREVGRVTTFEVEPTVGPCLAFAYLSEPWCESGTRVDVNRRPALVAGMRAPLDRDSFKELII